nr:Uma2 family endonuclease [[Limnothrix rosea] IAM M-220]
MTLPLELSLDNWQLSDKQFFQLCQQNKNYHFERSAQGDLVIMPPTGGETSQRNARLTAQLWLWHQKYRLGKTFDPSGDLFCPIVRTNHQMPHGFR